MKPVAFALAIAVATATLAAAVDDVRQAESGFAKAFADRDKDKFFAYVADDATFLSGVTTSRGKQQVIERWSRFFTGPEAPFSWAPERVSLSADGTLGLSTGPVHDPDGNHIGDYISTWRKEKSGAWKIVFDSTGPGPAPLAPVEDGFITTSDGATLYYRKIGRGPRTVIAPLDFVLHPFLRQLSDIATVITYDMRSRGRSSRVENVETLSIEQDVRDLEAVREHFQVEKFVPVGYSYLGKMVVMYAAAHPDRVTRIVQLGPAANREVPGGEQNADDFGAPPADVQRWRTMRDQGMAEKAPREFCVAQMNMLRYYLTATPKGAERFDVKTNCELENEWPVHFARATATLWPSVEKAVVSDADLKKVTMPVLTIHGTKDRNAPYEGGVEWVKSLPDARLVTIDGAAHAMWLDDPAATFAALRSFLR